MKFQMLYTFSAMLNIIRTDSIHAAGIGSHSGDTGNANILFSQDVIHHGGGKIFIGNNNGGGSFGGIGARGGSGSSGAEAMNGGTLSVKELQSQIIAEEDAADKASIDKDKAKMASIEVEKQIAETKERSAKRKLHELEDLNERAAVEQHQRPEVLGKRVIPIATFTEESNPLSHHIREMRNKIMGIKAMELAAMQSQKSLTRLDDITDKFIFNKDGGIQAKQYRAFVDAGHVGAYASHIPVLNSNGAFYLRPHAGAGSHYDGSHTFAGDSHGDHYHMEDHGFHLPNTGDGTFSGANGYVSYGNEAHFDDLSFGHRALPEIHV